MKSRNPLRDKEKVCRSLTVAKHLTKGTSTLWAELTAKRLREQSLPIVQGSIFLKEAQLANDYLKNSLLQQFGNADEVAHEQVTRIIGQHLLAEFQVGQKRFTAELLHKTLLNAAQYSGATILNSHFFNTKNGGISGVIVIAESHFIVHYFPSGYLALDIYTCGDRIKVDKALEIVASSLAIQPCKVTQFKRGVTANDTRSASVRLRPGIANSQTHSLRFYAHNRSTSLEGVHQAKHFIIEQYLSPAFIITNGESLINCFADAFGRDFQYVYAHEFEPKGIAGASLVLLGAGVHVTTHPWPEVYGYTPIDVFASQEASFDPSVAIKRLIQHLSIQNSLVEPDMQTFYRGVRC